MQPERDESPLLAAVLGLSLPEWEELFGRGWAPSNTESWHLRGNPPQLMLRVVEHGVFLGVPVGHRRVDDQAWAPDAWPPVDYRPTSQEYVGADDLVREAPEVVKWMLATRRRRFRWCPCCWQHTAPEWWAVDRCLHCAAPSS